MRYKRVDLYIKRSAERGRSVTREQGRTELKEDVPPLIDEEVEKMVVLAYLVIVALFYGVLSATAKPDPSSESLLILAKRLTKRRSAG